MRIVFKTTIDRDLFTVSGSFDEQLFKYLMPPLGFAKIVRYEGQEHGNIVEIGFRIPFMRNWIVVIKDSWKHSREFVFVDRGLQVPLGIYYWQHIHKIVSLGKNRCVIIDDIEFESSFILQDYINYVLLYLMFFPRRYLYRKYFRINTQIQLD